MFLQHRVEYLVARSEFFIEPEVERSLESNEVALNGTPCGCVTAALINFTFFSFQSEVKLFQAVVKGLSSARAQIEENTFLCTERKQSPNPKLFRSHRLMRHFFL